MATPDLISELPLELAHRILCMFSYLELLPVVGTCRRWRQIATDCPAYWAHMQLAGPTDGEANTLALRMRSARGRPCTAAVMVIDPWPTLSSIILPAVASGFRGMSWLNLYVHVSHSREVFQILTQPALNLTILEVGFDMDSPDDPLVVLPRDLLHGEAPCLKTVWLENVIIPFPPPAVFESLVAVGFGFQQPPTMTKEVPNLWPSFPNMRIMMLGGTAILGDSVLQGGPWQSIEWLRFRTFDAAVERTFACTPDRMISAVPHVELPCAIPDLVNSLLSHISGPLQVAAEMAHESSSAVRVHFGDTLWRRSRSFLTDISDWKDTENPLFDVFRRADVVERIVSLTIPEIVWQSMAQLVPWLLNLLELRVVFDFQNGLGLVKLAQQGRLACPALKRLVLRVDEGEFYVTLDDVRSFIALALPGLASPLELLLEDVVLFDYSSFTADRALSTLSCQSRYHWDYPHVDCLRPETCLGGFVEPKS